MISIFPYGLNKERGAEKITIATNLAQAKMEDLINTPYNQLTTGVITESSLATIDQDFASFSRTSEINYLDGDLNVAAEETDLKKIKITVSWIDAQEEDINDITLYSIITKQ
ncbi:hypothetical protein KJ840_04155 [Patescibacteria group bacterium]|nr:hypothetical protein [Patescibacteria group bacterium]